MLKYIFIYTEALRWLRPAGMLLVGLFILGPLSSSVAAAEDAWYLHGDGVPLATLSEVAPTTALANHDPGRDDALGLLIQRGGAGMAESDPVKFQQWVAAAGSVAMNGSTALVFWAAMKDYGTPRRGIVEAYLLDCEPTGAGCVEIARGSRDILDWSGGWGFWSRHSIDFGLVIHTVPDGRSLAVRVVVNGISDDDMLFAYDATGFQSHLTSSAPGDIAIDCEFSDWTNGDGTEFMLHDEGGPDDWSSPRRLDLTAMAVSSNLVDAIQILVAFDDVPVAGGTAGTLFDTNLNGNADYALVASVDGANVELELYHCDDTIIDGCGSAVLLRTYDDSCYCAAAGAGPWNNDTLVEIAVPFADIGTEGGPMVLTSLISYAAASLLTSPKDSMFGAGGEDYQPSIYYDCKDGTARVVASVGAGYVIRRATDPSAVRSAPAHATVTYAPFDDLSATLGDGQSYYYVVEKVGGMPVQLSAHPNYYDGVVRLGFDDDDPLTAAVDAAYSVVSLDVASIPADGTTHATLSLTPRDAGGELVGAGCDIVVDATDLAPGALAGPVRDHLNGRYTVPLVATATGTGEVVVTVEGITLIERPTIEFTSP